MSDTYDLEKQLTESKEAVSLRDMAVKLAENYEFRKLILEYYCNTEAVRYLQNSCDPTLNDRQRADSLAIAQSSSHLKRFLQILMQMGRQAEMNIPRIEDEIVRVRQEQED